MRCSKCQKLHDAAADGLLSDKLSRKVRDHLALCPTCSLVWQENEGLRLILRESSSPADMPDAAYFARLARVTIEKANAEQAVSVPGSPRSRLAQRLAGLFDWGDLGVEGIARGVALVAIGLIAGFIVSRNLVSLERRMPDFASPERTEFREERVIVRVPEQPARGPTDMAEPTYDLPSAPMTAVAVADRQPESVIQRVPTPGVDPALIVQTWQKTVDLLNKVPSSEEVERLRQIQTVSRQVQPSAVLARLQDLKFQLVRTGQTDYISDVHRIEEVFKQLALASRDSQANEFAHLETYQKAEQALIEKNYDRAVRLFQMVVLQAPPGSYLAARATYQMGNINFEHFRDYKNAWIDYEQCLGSLYYPSLSTAMQDQIHERVEQIAQNSVDSYAPMKIYYEAKATTQPAVAVGRYAALLKRYPKSPLVRLGIAALAQLARQASDDSTVASQVLEALDTFQNQNLGHPFETHAQMAVADVTYYCIRNRAQAVVEYTKVLEKAQDPDLITTARERLGQLEKAR